MRERKTSATGESSSSTRADSRSPRQKWKEVTTRIHVYVRQKWKEVPITPSQPWKKVKGYLRRKFNLKELLLRFEEQIQGREWCEKIQKPLVVAAEMKARPHHGKGSGAGSHMTTEQRRQPQIGGPDMGNHVVWSPGSTTSEATKAKLQLQLSQSCAAQSFTIPNPSQTTPEPEPIQPPIRPPVAPAKQAWHTPRRLLDAFAWRGRPPLSRDSSITAKQEARPPPQAPPVTSRQEDTRLWPGRRARSDPRFNCEKNVDEADEKRVSLALSSDHHRR
jgi:hypothetical protein